MMILIDKYSVRIKVRKILKNAKGVGGIKKETPLWGGLCFVD
jgi:hypothetical protein